MKIRCVNRQGYLDFVMKICGSERRAAMQKELVELLFAAEDNGTLIVELNDPFRSEWQTNIRDRGQIVAIPKHEQHYWEQVK